MQKIFIRLQSIQNVPFRKMIVLAVRLVLHEIQEPERIALQFLPRDRIRVMLRIIHRTFSRIDCEHHYAVIAMPNNRAPPDLHLPPLINAPRRMPDRAGLFALDPSLIPFRIKLFRLRKRQRLFLDIDDLLLVPGPVSPEERRELRKIFELDLITR